MTEHVTDLDLARVMKEWPRLCDDGIVSPWLERSYYPGLTCDGQPYTFAMSRSHLAQDVDRFRTARAWLRDKPRTKAASADSYGWKHRAEPEIGYTTNGTFIAAAIAEGYTVRGDDGHPNAWINLSKRAAQ